MRTTIGVNAKARRPFRDFDLAFGASARLFRGECYETLATTPRDLFADATARLLGEALGAIDQDALPAGSDPRFGIAVGVL